MTDNKFALPIHWNDHEDIAMELYESLAMILMNPKI